MRSIISALSVSGVFFASSLAYAIPFSETQTQDITESGQFFQFDFVGVPQPGTEGQLSITLNGDYSSPFPNVEFTIANLDNADGSVQLGNEGSGQDNVVSNTIDGLVLSSWTEEQFSFNDWELNYIFEISDALLNSMISDNMVIIGMQNSDDVNIFDEFNNDFIQVGLSYEAIVASAPVSALLLGVGMLGIGVAQRARRSGRGLEQVVPA